MRIQNLFSAFTADAVEICHILQRHGHRAAIVGGPVRDHLLGIRANDIDIASSATPEQVEQIFREFVAQGRFRGIYEIGTGREHGTLCLAGNEGMTYEVTTFRQDVETDGRHARVQFVDSLEEDLLRRDFTINAMAIEPLPDQDEGVLVDPYGGLQDLKDKRIRAVGVPIDRFREDRLRILRAYRFAARFGFRIERQTRLAMKAEVSMIRNSDKPVSWERIRDEMNKMFEKTTQRGWVSFALKAMDQDGVMDELFPEFAATRGITQGVYHRFTTDKHIRRATDAMDPRDPDMRWIMFFHDLGKPATRTEEVKEDGQVKIQFLGHEDVGAEIADRITHRLRMSSERRRRIVEGVKHHMALRDANRGVSRRTLLRIDRKLEYGITLEDLLEIRLADKRGSGKDTSEVRQDAEEAIRSLIGEIREVAPPNRVSDLAINGKTLQMLGLKPGPLFRLILDRLAERVIDEPELNNEEQLVEIVKSWDLDALAQEADSLNRMRQTPPTSSHSRTR